MTIVATARPRRGLRLHSARRAGTTAAALLLAATSASACSAFHAYFPSRDEVYKPVPVSLGEERVVGRDTTFVLAGRGYRVVTHDRDLLPDAKTALDRTSSAYRRFVAVEPPVIDVRLQLLRAPRRGEKADSARRAPAPPRDSGRVVTMVAYRADDRGGRGGVPRGMTGGGGYATQLVHAWLASWADEITHTPAPTAPASAPLPTPAADSGRGAARGGAFLGGPADDPRIPDWIERAIPALVTGTPDAERASAQLSRHPEKLIPLRTLLSAKRPESDRRQLAAAGDQRDGDQRRDEGPTIEGGRGGRGGFGDGDERAGERGGDRGGRRGGGRDAALEGAALFDAEATSVAAYLAEKEGGAFVGDVYRTVVSGLTLEDALRAAHALPHDLDTFERGWRSWLDVQAGKAEDYGPRSRGG